MQLGGQVGRNYAVETVPAFRVVKHLVVIEHISPGILSCAVDFSLDSLPLQQLKEALSHGIVVTVERLLLAVDSTDY